jgi:hypothetical protein
MPGTSNYLGATPVGRRTVRPEEDSVNSPYQHYDRIGNKREHPLKEEHMKHQERIQSEFKAMTAPQLVILGGIALNTLLALILLAQLSGLSSLKTSLDSSISSVEQRINDALAKTEIALQTSVSNAVAAINSSGSSLTCSGSYSGSVNIDFPNYPDYYSLSGSVTSFGSMTGTLRSYSLPSLTSYNDSTGTISLDCR